VWLTAKKTESFGHCAPALDTKAAPLLATPFSNTLKGMEVHFTPEQEKRLTQIAANAGTDPEGWTTRDYVQFGRR
jgi:hypothetical protein